MNKDNTIQDICKLMLMIVCGLILSGCLGPLYGVYVAVTPEEEDEYIQETGPIVVIDTVSRLNATPAIIEYTLFDAENEACTISVEYSVDGTNWYSATMGSGGSGTNGVEGTIEGTDHTFIWNYNLTLDADLSDPETVGVMVRVQASDPSGLSGSDESMGHSLGGRI